MSLCLSFLLFSHWQSQVHPWTQQLTNVSTDARWGCLCLYWHYTPDVDDHSPWILHIIIYHMLYSIFMLISWWHTMIWRDFTFMPPHVCHQQLLHFMLTQEVRKNVSIFGQILLPSLYQQAHFLCQRYLFLCLFKIFLLTFKNVSAFQCFL